MTLGVWSVYGFTLQATDNDFCMSASLVGLQLDFSHILAISSGGQSKWKKTNKRALWVSGSKIESENLHVDGKDLVKGNWLNCWTFYFQSVALR